MLDHLHVVLVDVELVWEHEVSSLDSSLPIKDVLTPIIVNVEAPDAFGADEHQVTLVEVKCDQLAEVRLWLLYDLVLLL